MLMNRNAAAPFWKAARRNVPGLPHPFPEMSEPAFANLCFSPYCHVRAEDIARLELNE